MSNMNKPELRAKVDALLDTLIKTFYDNVPYGKHMLSADNIDLEYYKRHTIETILRLRMKRTVDALAIRYFTKRDPVRAKAWAKYTDEEMLHDAFFVKDLQSVGVSREEIYSTEPLFATKLMMGYLLYGIEYEENPLALISSVYFVEYTTIRTQPQWIGNLEKVLGKEKLRGARAHVDRDINDTHDDFVWEVLASMVNTQQDEERVLEHMKSVFRLFVAYFRELYEFVVEGKKDPLEVKAAGTI
jgi:hypothetical protein